MAQVAVTVVYGSKQKIDLALPDDVPCQFLAEALSKALNCSRDDVPLWTIVVRENGTKRKISAASSLNDDGILCGSTLELTPEDLQLGQRAYLLSHTRVKFLLKSTNRIGRKDLAHGSSVDIDLLPLSAEKVISRQHAVITLKKDQYVVEDKSRHGTWVNGQKIAGPVTLKSGDVIGFGPAGRGTSLTFLLN